MGRYQHAGAVEQIEQSLSSSDKQELFRRMRAKACNRLLVALMNHCNYQSVNFIARRGRSKAFKNYFMRVFPALQFQHINTQYSLLHEIKADVLWIDLFRYPHQLSSDVLSHSLSLLNDDGLVFLNGRLDALSKSVWEQIQADVNITVTLDFFYCRVAFAKKNQAKEHFQIRL